MSGTGIRNVGPGCFTLLGTCGHPDALGYFTNTPCMACIKKGGAP